MKLTRVGIVFNPAGGSARKGAVDKLVAALGEIQVLRLATTATPGSATRLAEELHRRNVDLVIAIGGDGTVCQVAEGLIGTSTPMTVFPGGTGNLFARAFFAPPTAAEFVDMLQSGQPQPVDMIELSYEDLDKRPHRRLLLVALGLGKLSDAISEASPMMKKILGKLAYVIRVTRACLSPFKQSFRIRSATRDINEPAAAVFVLNVVPPTMSMLSRGCNAGDGLADVCVMTATNPWQMLKLAVCLAFGCPHRSSHYRTLRTSELTIASDTPVNPNIDGDPSHLTREVHMRVLPKAVNMLLAG